MRLKDLIKTIDKKDQNGIPNWMLGYFKRKSISFYNGKSDFITDVCWFQSRTFTIDLRLPKRKLEKKDIKFYSKYEFEEIANYEGWIADSIYDGKKLFWKGGVSYLNTNKWPEPAFVQKVGNCMMEFCPSNSFVEDWRLQNTKEDSLIGLELIEEINLTTNEILRNSGGLIICGEYAAICLGRDKNTEEKFSKMDFSLEDILLSDDFSNDEKAKFLNFETSVARGNLDDGYDIILSTNPNKYDEKLLDLDYFEFSEDKKYIYQIFEENNQKIKRVYKIDMIDSNFKFEYTTKTTQDAKNWFKKEERTLNRYLENVK
jgi:hypothetical protein